MRSLKIYLIVLLVPMLIFGTACKFDWLTGPDDPDIPDIPDIPDDPNEECEYPLEPEIGNVGDTIRSCHFEVTFEWAKRTENYKNTRPRDRKNNILVVFYIKVKLIKFNKETPWIFSGCFMVEDNQGNKYYWDGLGGDDELKQMRNGDTETQGTVTIEVPKSSSDFTAIFFVDEDAISDDDLYPDKIKCRLGF